MKLICVCVLSIFIGLPSLCSSAELRSVQVIRNIANRSPGPSLEAYQNANSEVAMFLSQKVGMNVGCYVAPTRTGYTIIWIDVESPELTSALRSQVELIVQRCLNGTAKGQSEEGKP